MAKDKFVGNQFRINSQIRSKQVSLVDSDNQMLGQFGTEEAIQLARTQGLDLVEINSKTNPPIAKICDYNKFLYEQKKKAKLQKKNVQKLHTIQIHLGIEENDLNHKFKQIKNFLRDGDLVKFALILVGRQMQFKQQAFSFMDECLSKLSDVAAYDGKPKLAGRNIEILLRKVSDKQIKF